MLRAMDNSCITSQHSPAARTIAGELFPTLAGSLIRAECRRINLRTVRRLSHGSDFDVTLDVRKICHQPVGDGGEGCASEDFPDHMIGRFLLMKKVHKVHAVTSPIFRESLTASHRHTLL